MDGSAAIVVNPRSGRSTGQADGLARRLAATLRQSGTASHRTTFDPNAVRSGWRRELEQRLAEGADHAYVLGGDGTVLAVATAVLGRDVPLGIVPLGTANLLARDLGMPLEPERAVAALIDAQSAYIDVGRVNGKPFLCASMLGMTTELARTREAARGLGTWRAVPRMIRKAYWLLKRYPFRHLSLVLDDDQLRLRTRALLIANNPLSPTFGLYPRRARIDDGVLGIYGVRDGPLHDLPRLVLALLAGSWASETRIFDRTARRVTIETGRPHRVTVLNDGEQCRLDTPLRYEILPRALPVLVPASGAGSPR
jgi:diacylglycerol kinase family enzyme